MPAAFCRKTRADRIEFQLRSRPPESFGLKPFHVDDAIKSAFNGRPTVFGLTAPQDGVPPTRPINAMARHEIRCSMSRKGNCWDNAVSESFFASLKKELVYQQDYATREEARQSNFQWIETFYNRTRLHSHLGYMSPEQFEQQS